MTTYNNNYILIDQFDLVVTALVYKVGGLDSRHALAMKASWMILSQPLSAQLISQGGCNREK